MLSSVAERLYWLARYIERAENTARLVKVNALLILDLPKRLRVGWGPLIRITGTEMQYNEEFPDMSESKVESFMLWNRKNPSSVLVSLMMARENARTTRDVLPYEAWEQINELSLLVQGVAKKGPRRQDRYDLLDTIILQCQAITGLLAGTMSQGYGYQFLRLGRNLERADMTTRMVDASAANIVLNLPEATDEGAYEDLLWTAVLRSISGFQMYRQSVPDRVRGEDVVEFLLRDTDFPRSVAHCLMELESCLPRLPNAARTFAAVAEARDLLKGPKRPPRGRALHRFIDRIQIALVAIADAAAETWFARKDSTAGQSQSQTAAGANA